MGFLLKRDFGSWSPGVSLILVGFFSGLGVFPVVLGVGWGLGFEGYLIGGFRKMGLGVCQHQRGGGGASGCFTLGVGGKNTKNGGILWRSKGGGKDSF